MTSPTTQELRKFCIEKAVDNAKGRTAQINAIVSDAQAMEAYITGTAAPGAPSMADRLAEATVTATIGGARGTDIVGEKR